MARITPLVTPNRRSRVQVHGLPPRFFKYGSSVRGTWRAIFRKQRECREIDITLPSGKPNGESYEICRILRMCIFSGDSRESS